MLSATDNPQNRVSIGGIDHYLYPGMQLMSVTGNELRIVVPGGGPPTCAGGDYWWEWLTETPGDNEAFELCGVWRGPIDDPLQITGTISGSFIYYRGVGPRWATNLFCGAGDHHFTLTKR